MQLSVEVFELSEITELLQVGEFGLGNVVQKQIFVEVDRKVTIGFAFLVDIRRLAEQLGIEPGLSDLVPHDVVFTGSSEDVLDEGVLSVDDGAV